MRKTFILPAMLAIAACSGSSSDPLTAGREALASQDFDRARIELLAGLKEEPRNPALLELLADVQLRTGDGAAARKTLDRLAALGGKGRRFDQLMAEALLRLDKPEEALSRLGNDAAPESIRIRAAALLATQDYAGAVSLWQQGVASGLTRDGLRMAYDYASYLLESGDLTAARAISAQMAQVEPKGFETMLLDGKIALMSGDAKATQQKLAAAAERFPRRIEPFCGQAEALELGDQFDQALGLLADAEKRIPNQACVTEVRLTVWARQGKWTQIRDLLQDREDSLDPTSPVGTTYGEALLRLGRPQQARAIFNRALLASPQNPYARLMLTEAHVAAGDPAAALETVAPLADSVLAGERVLVLAEYAARATRSPAADRYAARLRSGSWRQAESLEAAGQAAMGRQDWPAAIEAWQGLAAQGSDPEIERRLAQALHRAGRSAEAIAAADRFRALQPNNPDAVYLAGLIRVESKSARAEGLALLELAAKRQPANFTYQQALSKAKAAGS